MLYLLTCCLGPWAGSRLQVIHSEFEQRWLISQAGDYTPGTESLFRHSPYREPVGKKQWCIWLCSWCRMRHYWLVSSNGAHLVMLMMMALSQQETGNQWNGPWLKWIMMPAGGPEWSKVHNMPLLIFIFALRYYLRSWYRGPFFPSSSQLLIQECFFYDVRDVLLSLKLTWQWLEVLQWHR